MVRVILVGTLVEALKKLAYHGIDMTVSAAEAIGSQQFRARNGREVTVLDYRPVGEPYTIDWVFSAEERGREIARINVAR